MIVRNLKVQCIAIFADFTDLTVQGVPRIWPRRKSWGGSLAACTTKRALSAHFVTAPCRLGTEFTSGTTTSSSVRRTTPICTVKVQKALICKRTRNIKKTLLHSSNYYNNSISFRVKYNCLFNLPHKEMKWLFSSERVLLPSQAYSHSQFFLIGKWGGGINYLGL